VSNYGAALALLRGQQILAETTNIDTVLLSILVGYDLERDKLVYNEGVHRPYLSKNAGLLDWVLPSNFDAKGTRNNPRWNILQYSYLYNYLANRLAFLPDLSVTRRTEPGNTEITDEEIIEYIYEELDKFGGDAYIILQYNGYFEKENLENERMSWIEAGERFKAVHMIDLYESLLQQHQSNHESIWRASGGHYTFEGNTLVCNLILEGLNPDQDEPV
jgi:hypothetical protein